MDFPLISRRIAEDLLLKNNISLAEAKNLLESTASRIHLSDDVKPIYDEDGFYLGTQTKVKPPVSENTYEVKWGNPWSLSLEELFDENDGD